MRPGSRPPGDDRRPRKRLGQHFLIDRGAARRIVEAAELAEHDLCCEIGPGRGALTAALAEGPASVAAVELDPRWVDELRERHAPHDLQVIHADILDVSLAQVLTVLGAEPGSRLVLVGNLPYNVSKPVAQKLLREQAQIERAVLMFQREVVDRLIAVPGGRDYGPLGILAGELFVIERLFDVGPSSFRPPPRVRSSVTRWQRHPQMPSAEFVRRLRRVLGVCFASRRRTLLNNLRAVLVGGEAAARDLLDGNGIDPSRRAETLSREEFRLLAAGWPDSLDVAPPAESQP